jgi:hypothetical protein
MVSFGANRRSNHPEAGALEVFEVEPLGRAGGGETPGVAAGKHQTLLPL